VPSKGEVEDYFLFPAGKLKGGSVPLERATASHMSYQAMRDLFEDLEPIAVVEHQRVRARAAKTRRSMRRFLMGDVPGQDEGLAA
jgi:hypothetical protein